MSSDDFLSMMSLTCGEGGGLVDDLVLGDRDWQPLLFGRIQHNLLLMLLLGLEKICLPLEKKHFIFLFNVISGLLYRKVFISLLTFFFTYNVYNDENGKWEWN